jgi:hypothetical protein
MVVGIEMQIITSMSRFPVHFCGQFWTPLQDQNAQERKGIISFNFPCEFDCRSNIVEMKKLLQYCWSMGPNHESVVDISEPFSLFMVCCIQCSFLKMFRNYITDHRRYAFYEVFNNYIYVCEETTNILSLA